LVSPKALLKSCFGEGNVDEVTEDGSEAPHAKVLKKAMVM
jgi:hypothetical protein